MADYRASAPGGIDSKQDQEDQRNGHKIAVPMKCLWGSKGIIGSLEPNEAWTEVCLPGMYKGGKEVDSNHYIPENASKQVLEEVADFFSSEG